VRVAFASNSDSNNPVSLVIIFLGPRASTVLENRGPNGEIPRTGWILYFLGSEGNGNGTESYEELLAMQERLGFVNRGLPQEQLSNIATMKYTVGTIPNTSCSVCLYDFAEEEDVRGLQCGHWFHQNCVDNWLVNHRNSCPLCREPAIKKPQPTPEIEGETS